jgi:phospholipase/carboxylesterase
METNESVFSSKGVKELRSILQGRNVDYSDCIEKSELVARVLETMDKEPLVQKNVKISGLDCTVIQNARSDFDSIIVFIHGYGANSDDLSNIASNVIIPQVKSKVKIVFPNAPLQLQTASFAWWHIDLAKYVQHIQQSGILGLDNIVNDVPAGFEEASTLIQNLIKDLSQSYNVPINKIIVGGFSQGAILSLDVGLKLEVAGIVSWSAAMMNGLEWKKLAQTKKVRVLQSHGLSDPLIPYVMATKIKTEIFEPNQYDVQFVPFKGQHAIPPEVLVQTLSFIKSILNES